MPGSTPKGVPYILGTDAAADLDTQMQALAEWVDAAPGIASLTTAARDALAGANLWTGRVIFNTTVGRNEVWTGSAWVGAGTAQVTPANGAAVPSAGYPIGRSYSTNAAGVTGWPTTAAGVALTTRMANDDAEQVWVSLATGLRYTRVALANVWGAWVQIGGTKTIRIPHTWHVPGEVKVASGDIDYILPMWVAVPAGATATLVAIYGRLNSGTSVTYNLQRALYNNTFANVATGLVAVSSNDTGDVLSTALTAGGNPDKIRPLVTAVSGTPKNLALTVVIEYTF